MAFEHLVLPLGVLQEISEVEWVPYLLAAEIAYKELHLGIIKPLADIEYIDSIASCQQLLHHVLPQEPRASNHCALLGLGKEEMVRGPEV